MRGCDEAKSELQEVVAYLKSPSAFTEIGAQLPKGILLVGEPGTGKTLLARAIAGEAGVPFFYCSGSSFDEIYVGVGSKRVRSLFGMSLVQFFYFFIIPNLIFQRTPRRTHLALFSLMRLMLLVARETSGTQEARITHSRCSLLSSTDSKRTRASSLSQLQIWQTH